MTAYVSGLCDCVAANLLLQRKVPELSVSGVLFAWRPERERYIAVHRQRSRDGRRIGVRNRGQVGPTCAGTKRSWCQQIGTRLSIAGAPVANGPGVHDAVTSANNQTAACVPGEANPRAKFLLGGVKRGVRRIYAELLPLRGERIEESIAVVDFMERLIVLPSQSQVQRQPGRELEVVLHKKRIGPRARRNKCVLDLHTAFIHHAEQEISKAISRL